MFVDYGIDKPINGSTVASTGAVTSDWFPCSNSQEFSVWVKATSVTGTADVKVEFVQFPLTSTFASGDPTLTTSIVATLATEAWAEYVNTTINAVVAAKYRIVVTGVASNPADTVAYVFVSKRTK